MPPIFPILMLLLTAYTVLVEPFLRTYFYRRLKKQLKVDANARLLFYRTQLLWEWTWVVVIIVIMSSIQQPFEWLGLTMPSMIGWIILVALLLGIGLSIVLLRRNPGAMAAMRRSLEPSSILLPSTHSERKWFTATAITAGICEELLYRGFLIHSLQIILPGIGWLFVSILSGIIYGLSRAYFGRKGILQATLIGFSFAIVYFISGNLLQVISSNQPLSITVSVLSSMVFHIMTELCTLAIWEPKDSGKETK